MTSKTFRRLIPTPVKRTTKQAFLDYKFRRAMRKICRLAEGELPARELLNELQVGWGNQGFAATCDYLYEVMKLATATGGPILECGSGLTTILIGSVAGRRGIRTYSLEHIPEWRKRVNDALVRYKIPNVEVLFSPLRDYGAFTWYEPPLAHLPDKFSLVICDGPPGTTQGGRFGLLPTLGQRLPAGSLILFDDADRPGEAAVLQRWSADWNVRVALSENITKAFATVARY
jgi:predicted O-methyltransferase YrrM